mmetsp:Transcript_24383/g.79602  ORF Transcript_24383/g.79602 Transcript_24383/m.79602 type:complete len:656 (+) Transcript_24383:1531-3498(+)
MPARAERAVVVPNHDAAQRTEVWDALERKDVDGGTLKIVFGVGEALLPAVALVAVQSHKDVGIGAGKLDVGGVHGDFEVHLGGVRVKRHRGKNLRGLLGRLAVVEPAPARKVPLFGAQQVNHLHRLEVPAGAKVFVVMPDDALGELAEVVHARKVKHVNHRALKVVFGVAERHLLRTLSLLAILLADERDENVGIGAGELDVARHHRHLVEGAVGDGCGAKQAPALLVVLGVAEPAPAGGAVAPGGEEPYLLGGFVRDDHLVEVPARAEAPVVVPNLDKVDLAEVRAVDEKRVDLAALKVILRRFQLALTAVALGAAQIDAHRGVGPCKLDVGRVHDDFVGDVPPLRLAILPERVKIALDEAVRFVLVEPQPTLRNVKDDVGLPGGADAHVREAPARGEPFVVVPEAQALNLADERLHLKSVRLPALKVVLRVVQHAPPRFALTAEQVHPHVGVRARAADVARHNRDSVLERLVGNLSVGADRHERAGDLLVPFVGGEPDILRIQLVLPTLRLVRDAHLAELPACAESCVVMPDPSLGKRAHILRLKRKLVHLSTLKVVLAVVEADIFRELELVLLTLAVKRDEDVGVGARAARVSRRHLNRVSGRAFGVARGERLPPLRERLARGSSLRSGSGSSAGSTGCRALLCSSLRLNLL